MGKLTKWLSLILMAIVLPATSALSQERIRVGLPVPTYGPFTPIYAAEELGLFKKNGVAVEITSYKGGSAAQEALAAGYVDIMISTPAGAAIAISKGVKQKIVGALTLAAFGFHILVPTDSPIKSMKDLDGKSVGVSSAGSLVHMYLLWAARNNGVRVISVPVGAPGLVPTLKLKKVDASSIFPPMSLSLIASGEARSIFDVAKDMPPAMPEAWVATQAIIDKNPKAVEAVLLSVYEAVIHMKNNRDDGVRLLAKYTGAKDLQVLGKEYEVIQKMATSAKIEEESLAFSLELSKLVGATDLPPIKNIYLDSFSSVGVR